MRQITIVPGRRINKILFILFASILAVLLLLDVIFFVKQDDAMVETLLIVSAIIGAFALLYGILWAVFASKEKKENKLLNRQPAVDPREHYADIQGTVTFTLPRAELLYLAKKRLRAIEKWLWIAEGILFLILYVPVTITDGFGSLSRLATILALCVIIVVPGVVIQEVIYRSYIFDMPERIGLYIGRISVDDRTYPAYEMTEIAMSSPKARNASSSKVFRTLTITAQNASKTYKIDFRAPSAGRSIQPRWNQYDEFCEALMAWGSTNGVAVKMDFMD